jgi:hypothetical protein
MSTRNRERPQDAAPDTLQPQQQGIQKAPNKLGEDTRAAKGEGHVISEMIRTKRGPFGN